MELQHTGHNSDSLGKYFSQSIQESETTNQKDFPEIYDNPTIRHGLRYEQPQNWLLGISNQEIRPMNTN